MHDVSMQFPPNEHESSKGKYDDIDEEYDDFFDPDGKIMVVS